MVRDGSTIQETVVSVEEIEEFGKVLEDIGLNLYSLDVEHLKYLRAYMSEDCKDLREDIVGDAERVEKVKYVIAKAELLGILGREVVTCVTDEASEYEIVKDGDYYKEKIKRAYRSKETYIDDYLVKQWRAESPRRVSIWYRYRNYSDVYDCYSTSWSSWTLDTGSGKRELEIERAVREIRREAERGRAERGIKSDVKGKVAVGFKQKMREFWFGRRM